MGDVPVGCLVGSLPGALFGDVGLLPDGPELELDEEPVPDEPLPEVPVPDVPPVTEPETEVLLEPGVDAVADVESVGVVLGEELDDDVELGVLLEVEGVLDVVEPDVPEVPERSQPTTAAEARAMAAATGMSLFMNFSNQDS